MTTHDIRAKYVAFFKSQGHVVTPSASLLPENDPTTLFTGSGMQPMVPFLLGQPHPAGTRLTDSQKCFRAQDVDDVGDNRHTTFFEMLGNWSLGDYFKQEQIPWMFAFLTQELGLDPQQLYVTVFRGNESISIPRDNEAVALWQTAFGSVGVDAKVVDNAERDGMQGGRIFYYDDTKNWWSRAGVPANMPDGEPGGPDSEMFWDFGVDRGLHEQSVWKDEPCHVNCDCGRFLEIGNNVFMEYLKTATGFEKLKQKNVDFGGGLERIAAAVNNDPDVFKIDLFTPLRTTLEQLSGKTYGNDTATTKAFRVVMDHLRAATFLIADGAVPSNKDQGYFTRRFIRRAIRFADQLGISTQVCQQGAEAVINTYQNAYPELDQRRAVIIDELEREERKFRTTLANGLAQFSHLANNLSAGSLLDGQAVFDLWQSYGLPIELTQELAQEHHLTVDVVDFHQRLSAHQELSRTGSEQKFKGGLSDHSEQNVKYHTATHLLHAALRQVLGAHVEQKGSNITPERLRFDFSHSDKMTDEQKQAVEQLVNTAIEQDYPVSYAEMTVDEAKKKGAIGLFGEKYGERVKVYSIGDSNAPAMAKSTSDTFSREICGGPHVEHTGTLGQFKIIKEEASSAGVRRIKAVLG